MSPIVEPPYRVLVVDDDPWMLRWLAAMMPGMDVVTCGSGAEALEKLEQQPFEVVCSDFMMPQMSGLQLLHEIAQSDAEIGLLLVTSSLSRVCIEDQVGYNLLIKPIDPNRLLETVTRLGKATRKRRAELQQ